MFHLPHDALPNSAGAVVRERGDLNDKAQSAGVEKALTKENAPAATEAGFDSTLNCNYKRLPPYGKKLMVMRQAGKIPSRPVIISFDWNLARVYPRIIIPADANPAGLEFKFLAGIRVRIVYRSKDAHRVDALVKEIMRVNPCFLETFALDLLETGNALTIITPYQRVEVVGAA